MGKPKAEPEQVDEILADFLGRPNSTKAPIARPESVFGDEELPPDSVPIPSASGRIPRSAKRPDTARTDVQAMIERELDDVREEDLDAQYQAEGELDAQAHMASVHPRSFDHQTTERNGQRRDLPPLAFDEATAVGRRRKLTARSSRKHILILAGIMAAGAIVLVTGLLLVFASTSTSKETVTPRGTRTGVSDHEGTDGARPRAPVAKPKSKR